MNRLMALSLPLALAACAMEDPLTRPGLWQPIGANATNLAAMVADPQDLVTGVPDRTADGQLAAAAVARYRAGKLKDLPDVSISKIAPVPVNTSSPAGPE